MKKERTFGSKRDGGILSLATDDGTRKFSVDEYNLNDAPSIICLQRRVFSELFR
jgi:hypothetical protein